MTLPTATIEIINPTIHLITTVPRRRWAWLMDPNVTLRLIRLFNTYLQRHELRCLGYVLLPDRWTALVEQTTDKGVERLMRDFHRESALMFRGLYPEGPLWRLHYEDQLLTNAEAITAELVKLHRMPVERGLAASCEQYRWSSAADYRGTNHGLVTVAATPDVSPMNAC